MYNICIYICLPPAPIPSPYAESLNCLFALYCIAYYTVYTIYYIYIYIYNNGCYGRPAQGKQCLPAGGYGISYVGWFAEPACQYEEDV
jgi:hypothetical protein